MSGYHVIVEATDNRDDVFAGNVAKILCEAYPGHPWHIKVGHGVLVIKHMRITAKMGMVLHYKKVAHDYGLLRRGVLVAGGELLERAGLTRGPATDQKIGKVDGVADKDRVLQ